MYNSNRLYYQLHEQSKGVKCVGSRLPINDCKI